MTLSKKVKPIVLVGLIHYYTEMKNCKFKLIAFLISVLVFSACDNPKFNREYYDSGAIKVEERVNKESKVVYRKEYYENGGLMLEFGQFDGLLDGLLKKYSLSGQTEVEIKYDKGVLVGFVRYDSLGSRDYWKHNLFENDIPAFNDEFIQVVSYSDSGLVVNLSVPAISPFQILPITKNANWKSIDIKNGDWLILPKQDSIEVGIGIEMTDSTFFFMDYFKPIIISELP